MGRLGDEGFIAMSQATRLRNDKAGLKSPPRAFWEHSRVAGLLVQQKRDVRVTICWLPWRLGRARRSSTHLMLTAPTEPRRNLHRRPRRTRA